MGLVDVILNVAALLLFLNWREVRQARRQKSDGGSLIGLLKYAGKPSMRQWWFLALVPVILIVRALIVQALGPPLHWTPRLQLDLFSLPFRSDDLRGRMLTYSVLDFLSLLARVYILMLAAAVANRGAAEDDGIQRWIRWQLGMFSKWPFWADILLILAVAVGTWFAVTPLLRNLDVLPGIHAPLRTALEGFLLGLAALLTCNYLVIAVMILYFANTYVYFGKSPIWHFVHVTGQNLLRPFRSLPLVLGKLDFRPLLLIVVTAGAAYYLRLALERLYFNLARLV